MADVIIMIKTEMKANATEQQPNPKKNKNKKTNCNKKKKTWLKKPAKSTGCLTLIKNDGNTHISL